MPYNVESNIETYETVIGNTTFQVVSKYMGDTPFLDFIKNAIKRDVEIAIHSKGKEKLDL